MKIFDGRVQTIVDCSFDNETTVSCYNMQKRQHHSAFATICSKKAPDTVSPVVFLISTALGHHMKRSTNVKRCHYTYESDTYPTRSW